MAERLSDANRWSRWDELRRDALTGNRRLLEPTTPGLMSIYDVVDIIEAELDKRFDVLDGLRDATWQGGAPPVEWTDETHVEAATLHSETSALTNCLLALREKGYRTSPHRGESTPNLAGVFARALAAQRSAAGTTCAFDGCDKPLPAGQRLYCSPAHGRLAATRRWRDKQRQG